MLRLTYKNVNGVNMSKNKEENITFEQAIKELEIIINRLEEGDVPLDETIKLGVICGCKLASLYKNQPIILPGNNNKTINMKLHR